MKKLFMIVRWMFKTTMLQNLHYNEKANPLMFQYIWVTGATQQRRFVIEEGLVGSCHFCITTNSFCL